MTDAQTDVRTCGHLLETTVLIFRLKIPNKTPKYPTSASNSLGTYFGHLRNKWQVSNSCLPNICPFAGSARRTEKLLLSHTLTMRGKWCSKFGWIQPSGSGGNSLTDRWTGDRRTDAQKNNVAIAHPNHEGKWCCKFGWNPPSGLGDSVTDRWTHGKTDAQKNVAPHTLTMRESDVASLVEFRSGLGDSVTDQ